MSRISILAQALLLLSPILLLAQYTPDDLYDNARAGYFEGAYGDALESIDRYLLTERNTEGFYLQSMIFEAMGEDNKAIGALTNVLSMDRDHTEAYFKRGELYYKKGIYEQAINDFNAILDFSEAGPTNAIFFRIDQNGQEQVGVQTLATMKGQVYGLRGLCKQAIGNYDDANEDMTEAIYLDSSAQNYVNRALLYKEQNRTDLALNDLRVAISLDPNLIIGWYNLMLLDPSVKIPENISTDIEFYPMISYQGVEAFQNRDYVLAENLFRKALSIRPNDPLLLLNSGRLNYQQKRYYDAIAFFKKVLEVEASKFEAYYLIGNSFFQLQDFTQSASYYEQYLARDRSNKNIWYNAALAYFELEDIVRGCECLQKAAERGMVIDASTSLWQQCNQ